MTVEERLYSILTGDPGVAALIGTRLYPDAAPQGAALPYAQYDQAGREQAMTHDGPVDLNSYLMGISMFAASKAGAKSLARAVRAALNGSRSSAGGLRLLGVLDESEDGDSDQPLDGGEQGRFSCSATYRIWCGGGES